MFSPFCCTCLTCLNLHLPSFLSLPSPNSYPLLKHRQRWKEVEEVISSVFFFLPTLIPLYPPFSHHTFIHHSLYIIFFLLFFLPSLPPSLPNVYFPSPPFSFHFLYFPSLSSFIHLFLPLPSILSSFILYFHLFLSHTLPPSPQLGLVLTAPALS